jgi:NAD(P)-dependent dehydrogenase (short-subunit alcohol dehydrogenase family)
MGTAKHVLITGASSGLGAALFDYFVGRGWWVTGTAVEDVPANKADHLFRYDAREDNAAEALCGQLESRPEDWPGFDLVINNAGINAIRDFHSLDLEFMEQVMRVNCHAPVLLIREIMERNLGVDRRTFQGSGLSVINVISDAAWRPMRHSEAYNTSKAAFDMATRQMARELTKPFKMTIVGVRPGKMKGTGMSKYIDGQVQALRGWSPVEAMDYFVANSMTGLEQNPEDVARFIYEMYHNPLFRSMSGACIDLVG